MKKTFIILSGVLVVVAVLFINAGKTTVEDGYGIGDEVTDFSLENVNGKMVSLSHFSNAKGFIVTFTCNTCPYAKGYEQRIMDLDKKYAGKGFPVIAINPNDVIRVPEDSMSEMKKRSVQRGYTFPYLRDDTQEVAEAFGATKTPHMYVLSKSGSTFKVEFIGAIDDNPRDADGVSEKYVEAVVDALLTGKTPEYREKRAIGCTIKWKES